MIRPGIIDRYILSEIVKFLGMGILLIAGVFFATAEFRNVLNLICDIGINPMTALSITALQLPNTFVYCLPAGIILSSCLIILKLSQERNLIAVTLTGSHQARVLVPIFAFALFSSILSFVMSDELVPHCRRTATKLLLAGALSSELPICRNLTTLFQRDTDTNTNRLMLVGRYLKRNLENVVLFDLSKNKNERHIVWAKTGQWNRGRWQLDTGRVYDLAPNGGNTRVQSFDRMEVDGIGKIIDKMDKEGPLPTDQPTAELKRDIDKIYSKGQTPPPATLLRYFRRFSQPASCLLVVFIALPLLNVSGRRSGYFGLAYSGVAVALYFFIQQMTLAAGDVGMIAPLLAAWLPGVVALLPGLTLFRDYFNFGPKRVKSL